MNKKSFGYTLIELLVTMTIIAVLLGLSLVSYQGARKSARDGKRRADLEEIRSALEMYRTDNDSYPGGLGSLSGYLEVPSDPIESRQYYYSGSANSYVLCAGLETGGSDTCGDVGACGVNCNYQVRNP